MKNVKNYSIIIEFPYGSEKNEVDIDNFLLAKSTYYFYLELYQNSPKIYMIDNSTGELYFYNFL